MSSQYIYVYIHAHLHAQRFLPSRVVVLIFKYIISRFCVWCKVEQYGCCCKQLAVWDIQHGTSPFSLVLLSSLTSFVHEFLIYFGLDENVCVEPWRCRVCFGGSGVCWDRASTHVSERKQ